jgi:hypothetical protein
MIARTSELDLETETTGPDDDDEGGDDTASDEGSSSARVRKTVEDESDEDRADDRAKTGE